MFLRVQVHSEVFEVFVADAAPHMFGNERFDVFKRKLQRFETFDFLLKLFFLLAKVFAKIFVLFFGVKNSQCCRDVLYASKLRHFNMQNTTYSNLVGKNVHVLVRR